jgi:hypothetical protein
MDGDRGLTRLWEGGAELSRLHILKIMIASTTLDSCPHVWYELVLMAVVEIHEWWKKNNLIEF